MGNRPLVCCILYLLSLSAYGHIAYNVVCYLKKKNFNFLSGVWRLPRQATMPKSNTLYKDKLQTFKYILCMRELSYLSKNSSLFYCLGQSGR